MNDEEDIEVLKRKLREKEKLLEVQNVCAAVTDHECSVVLSALMRFACGLPADLLTRPALRVVPCAAQATAD